MLKSLNKNIIYVEKRNKGDGDVLDKNEKVSLLQFLAGDDMDFYEMFLVNNLSDEEMDAFFKLNPGFLKDYRVNKNRKK